MKIICVGRACQKKSVNLFAFRLFNLCYSAALSLTMLHCKKIVINVTVAYHPLFISYVSKRPSNQNFIDHIGLWIAINIENDISTLPTRVVWQHLCICSMRVEQNCDLSVPFIRDPSAITAKLKQHATLWIRVSFMEQSKPCFCWQ